MPFSLVRTRDGAGDSGPMSLAIVPTFDMDTNKVVSVEYEHSARPRLGVAMRVGSIIGRTYAAQDWWQTSLITEILDDSPAFVRFRTGNSEYEWKVI
jgi:hypothetical protein